MLEESIKKNCCNKIKKKFNENVLNNLMQSVSDQQAFWKNMRKISKNKYQPHNSISEQEWFNHFQKVLEQDNQDEDFDDFENCESDVYYDRPITPEEVLLAIQRLKKMVRLQVQTVLLANYLRMLDIWQSIFWLNFSMSCLTVVDIQIVGQRA